MLYYLIDALSSIDIQAMLNIETKEKTAPFLLGGSILVALAVQSLYESGMLLRSLACIEKTTFAACYEVPSCLLIIR